MELFLTFIKIGLFTFGGGYAMISLIEDICVTRKKWISHEELLMMTAVAESTPGPVAINCSTYIGYKQKGLPGAVAATTGVVLPSFCVILLISGYLNRFLEITWIANAFKGIKIAVGILIFEVAVRMIIKMKKSVMSAAILVCAATVMLCVNFLALKISSIVLLMTAGTAGLAAMFVKEAKKGGKQT